MDKYQKGIVHLLFLLVVVFVAVVGIGYYAHQNGQVRRSTSINETATSLPKTIPDTSNWKTYVNSTYNFSIKYPSSLHIFQEPTPYIHTDRGTSWILTIDNRQKNDSTGSTVTKLVMVQFTERPISGESGKPIEKIEETTMGIDNVNYFDLQGYPAVKVKQYLTPDDNGNPTETSSSISILKNGSLYHVSGYIKSTQNQDVDEIDQILSTFQFLD